MQTLALARCIAPIVPGVEHRGSATPTEALPSLARYGFAGVERDALHKKQRRNLMPGHYPRYVAVRASEGAVAVPPGPPPKAPVKKEANIGIAEIAADTFTFRGKCSERLKFEVEYNLKRGTTDNSYLIKGSSGTSLVDLPDQAWAEAFLEKLQTKTSLDSIKYLVLGHSSPKRYETLVALVKARAGPPLVVHCSNPAAKALQEGLPEEVFQKLDVKVVRAGDKLDLGEGHVLRFILTPTPRWPDGMMTYDKQTGLLFSQKFFSAHALEASDFDVGGWEKYGNDWRYFYDCMLAPAAKQASAALEKLPIVSQPSGPSYAGKRGLGVVKADLAFLAAAVRRVLQVPVKPAEAEEGVLLVTALCPIHGPIVRSTTTELVREYREWTAAALKQAEEASIAVIYASAYGNTSALAQAISRGVSRAGVSVESINCEFAETAEVVEAVRRSQGFVIGSPTLAGHMPTPVQEALGAILKDGEARGKPCGVFGSFGWSGEAVDELEQRLKDGGFSFGFPPIRCKFKPTEGMLQTCEESGTDLAQAVRKAALKRRAAKAKDQAAVASNVEQAVGHVVGSLCVLSSKSGDAESAMLASWVSQASFNPPGITVAVAKDRAVESLVLTGGKFALNVLGEGKYASISRQLLKPFAPGEPRFAGLETKEANNGCTILSDAISYLECTVTSRLEAGDHWILYATVDDGKLQDDAAVTAVHHRKTGARY